MGDSKEIIESFKDGIKKKQHLKSSKNRNNSKNNKIPGLMLSRIEEFIEIRHGEKGMNLKDRLLDTCVLKNLKHLFLNKEDENNKDNNDMVGYSIDNKNKTIIKFNKSPNQLQIEQFIFPDKDKKRSEKYLINDDSFDKIDLNNISENKGNINFIKKFKDNYQSDLEERIKKHKKVKSNIVFAPKKLKKELKGNKFKNTVLIKHSDINKILNPNSKRKIKSHDKEKDYNQRDKLKNNKREDIRKSKEKDKEKDNNYQKDKVKTKREESKNIKEKNDYKEEDNNNNISTIRRKKKSKTRKQGKITFLLNKGKNMNKKNDNFIMSNNNIEKIDISKKIYNNEDLSKNEEYIKKYSKNRIKSNKNNKRESIKSLYFENDKNPPKSPKSKKSKRNKYIKFQSVIFPKKNSLFVPGNRKLCLKQKRNSNISTKKGGEKDSENSSSSNIKSIKDSLSSNSEQKNNNKDNKDNKGNKDRNKKQTSQNNIKTYKEDYNNNNKNNEKKSKDSSDKNNNEKVKLKDNNGLKNSIKNNILHISQYKIKHVNDIYVGRSQNKKDEFKSPIMKVPVFSVVQPEKLIYFEYNRAYERPINQNQNQNQNNIVINNHKELLNEKDIKNDISDESKDNKIKKRNKSVFCCL